MIERTLALIKPDAFPSHAGAIITMATEAGLVPVMMKVARLAEDSTSTRTWCTFYAEHADKPFFKLLVEFLASAPVLVMVLEGDCAISHWRERLGAADPRQAAPGTVRARFGAILAGHWTEETPRVLTHLRPGEMFPVWKNAAHGSDSPESARREIDFFFGGQA